MEIFTSPEVIVNKSAEDFFNKISDLNNLQEIMPSQIENFKSTDETCSFEIQGMPKIELEICEKIKFSKVSLNAKNSPNPFKLNCFIKEKENQCQARLEINIEINMMMRMMIEKPLTQFLDVLSHKMQNF